MSDWVKAALDGRTAPRRPTLAVLGWVGIGLCGLVALVYGLLAGGVGGLLLGLLFALLPVPLLIFAVLSLDRLEPEPTRNLVLTFLWGAAVAIVIALAIEFSIGLVNPNKLFGAAVVAPFAEELGKGLIIFLILHLRKTELDGPTDGIVYAGMVGLGFAMSENIVYYGTALHEGAGNLIGTFVMRGIFSPLAHPLFTSATGIAMGYAALKRDTAARWLLPIGGVIVAMILHGLWNGATGTLGIVGLGAYYLLIMVPVLVGNILIAYFDRKRILGLMQTYLTAYVPAGVVHPDEIMLLSTMKARRKLRRLMRDYQQAGTELAMLDDKAARGTAGPEYGPRREALVRLLMLSKRTFPGNEAIARNLTEIEGTLPPPPRPRGRAAQRPMGPGPGPAGPGGYGQPAPPGMRPMPPQAGPAQPGYPPAQGRPPVQPPPGHPGQGQPPYGQQPPSPYPPQQAPPPVQPRPMQPGPMQPGPPPGASADGHGPYGARPPF